jgi:poly(A) polymerase Pap1
VVDHVAEALPGGVLHVVGSRSMGCALVGADLDLVVAVPGAVDLDRIVVPCAERVRPVVGARGPGLRFRLGELAVDLSVVATGDIPAEEAVDRRHQLGTAAAVALSAVSDANAVLAAVAGRQSDFYALARHVKAWAAAHGLDSAPHGGLPGLAWAVLAARTVREGESGNLRAEFFGRWAAWDWREPVTLLGDDVPAADDPMTIMTPSAPSRSCTEQVSAGMRDLITAELYAAWENRAGEPPHRRHAAWAVITAKPLGTEDFDVTLGRLRGRIRALLSLLPPDAHAWPAPFERGDTVRHAVGLGANPPTAAELTAIAGRWGELPGVHVGWAGNGEVPTLRR